MHQKSSSWRPYQETALLAAQSNPSYCAAQSAHKLVLSMAAKASSAAERIREAFGEALSCDTDAGHDELGVRWCRSRQHGNDSLADGPIKRCKRTTGYCSQRIRLYPATTRVVLNFSGAARRGWRS